MNDDYQMNLFPETSHVLREEKEQSLILVVDDCRITRRLLSLYLQESGYQVGLAGNGLEALEMLGREPYDLVITDLNMPRMDGVELTRIIRHDPNYGNIPVIILTTHGEDRERVQGMHAGASLFLTKPIGQSELIKEVKQWVTQGEPHLASAIR